MGINDTRWELNMLLIVGITILLAENEWHVLKEQRLNYEVVMVKCSILRWSDQLERAGEMLWG